MKRRVGHAHRRRDSRVAAHSAHAAGDRRWEDIMTVLQGSIELGMRAHLALGAAALLAVAAVPTLAQAPGRTPGVLEAGASPGVITGSFLFTEGPLCTPHRALLASDRADAGVRWQDADRR